MRIPLLTAVLSFALACSAVFAQEGVVMIKLTGKNKFDPDEVKIDPKKHKTIRFVCDKGTHDVTIDDGKGGVALFVKDKITPMDKPFEVSVADLVQKAGNNPKLRYVCIRHEDHKMIGWMILK